MSISSGVVTVDVLTCSTFTKSFTFPAKVAFAEIRNAGGADIKISFDLDPETKKYTVKGLDIAPVLSVQGGKTILKYSSTTSGNKIELLMWG